MEEAKSSYPIKEKWYNKWIFPLMPIIKIRKSDEYNTSGFTFKWLFFSFWSLDCFAFEFSINIDTHWGIAITFILPYLRGVIGIPLPIKLSIMIDRKLNRRPKSINQ